MRDDSGKPAELESQIKLAAKDSRQTMPPLDFPTARQPPVRIPLGRSSSSGVGDSSFPLPGGARLTIAPLEANVGGGKRAAGVGGASLTASLVSTSCLADSSPPLGEQELLVSPVYELVFTPDCQSQQVRRVTLTLPLLRRPLPLSPPSQRLRLAFRPATAARELDGSCGDGCWEPLEPVDEDNKSIAVRAAGSGFYAVVLSPISETFQVTPNGGLLNLKLDPIISVRIPKRGCLETADCCLTIIPFSEDRLALARRSHPSQTMDILALSPVYSFQFPPTEFKRPITLKLPLPHWLSETDDVDPAGNCVIVYQLSGSGGGQTAWQILDPGSSVKLTRNSISFDAKHLARYGFLSVAKGKAQRAALALPLLCSLNEAALGEVLLFAILDATAWRLCVDCAPQTAIVDRISDRVQDKGWQFLQRLSTEQHEQEQRQRQQRRFTRRVPAASASATADDSTSGKRLVPLRNGANFTVRISGADLALSQEDSATGERPVGGGDLQEVQVQYHQLLSDAPAVFRMSPTQRCRTVTEDFFAYLMEQEGDGHQEEDAAAPQAADGGGAPETLTFKAQISVLDESGEEISEHELIVNFATVKTYLGLKAPTPPPTPAPTPHPPTLPAPSAQLDRPGRSFTGGKRIPVLPRLRLRINELDPMQARIESFQRLTAPKKNLPAPIYLREPKVLSGRSLQALAEQVKQGLTLAVHLDLPESAITGIGFDALSGPAGLGHVTYKVLTHWKRTIPLRDRGQMVARLAEALVRTGRPDLADAVTECDATNREFHMVAPGDY